jgi:hypothetical protein
MKTLIFALAVSLSAVTQPQKETCPETASPSPQLSRAFADAEEDLDVRRNELGLLGSAPLFGAESAPQEVAQQSTAQPPRSADGR